MIALNSLSGALSVLSAMIAPVVLISACASLTLSTSQRLSRTIERTRKLLERFEVVMQSSKDDTKYEQERDMLYEQLTLAARRSRILHTALASLYISVTIFIGTSVILGVIAVANEHLAWIGLLFGMIGAGFLFYTGVLLIAETRFARRAIYHEMDFALQRIERGAPRKLRELQDTHGEVLEENPG